MTLRLNGSSFNQASRGEIPVKEMVTLTDVKELAKEAERALGISEEELINFIRDGAVRAYNASGPGRDKYSAVAEFVGDKNELRVAVRKRVVEEVSDEWTEISLEAIKQQGLNDPIGSTVAIKATDDETKNSIEAGFKLLKKMVAAKAYETNQLMLETKFVELRRKCIFVTITRTDGADVYVDLGGIEGWMPKEDQLPGETYEPGEGLVVCVARRTTWEDKANRIIVSRTDPELVIFALKKVVPEIDGGAIEVRKVARICGKKSRVAVYSQEGEAVGRCIGAGGSRVKAAKEELKGEEVEIVEWYADARKFVASSLKDAEIKDIHLDHQKFEAVVFVYQNDMGKAIGKDGENLKLAEDLTGFKIRIVEATGTPDPSEYHVEKEAE